MQQNKQAKESRDLFLAEYQGVLSTYSQALSGYPFGSVVPYCLNKSGEPVILISDIAQHTKNILVDPRVSLLAMERNAEDPQTVGRVTYIGNAEKLDDEDSDSIMRYYNFFPQSRDYHKIHGFKFYCIKCVRVRFIGGFGQIYWVEADNFLKANPFSFEEEQQMLEHMNTDHLDAIKHYCKLYAIPNEGSHLPELVGIDAEGFNIRINARIDRINFPEPVTNASAVRQALVEMAKCEIT